MSWSHIEVVEWISKTIWGTKDQKEEEELYYPLNLEKYSDSYDTFNVDNNEFETEYSFKSTCSKLIQNAKNNFKDTISEIKPNTKQIIKILVILNILIYLLIGLFIYSTV